MEIPGAGLQAIYLFEAFLKVKWHTFFYTKVYYHKIIETL